MKTSTPETLEQAKQNLFDFCDVLEELGITYWLDGGTILGAYRDAEFCDGDEDDTDVFCWANYKHLIPEVVKRMEAKGFYLVKHWKGDKRLPNRADELAFRRHTTGRLKIDFNFIEKKGSDAWGLAYIGDDEGIPQVVPAHFYEHLTTMNFKGRDFPAPSPVEDYLTHRYGNWKNKIHRTQYDYRNPEQLRALKPDFKFWEV